MKIERPDLPWGGTVSEQFNQWFDTHVEPINDALDKAVVVYGVQERDGSLYKMCSMQGIPDTHKALLINIEKIKQETIEDKALKLLHNHVKYLENWCEYHGTLNPENVQFVERAKALLEAAGGRLEKEK